MKTYRNTAARESFAASPITCFRGDYAFLSNFYPAPVCYRGNQYANNEAAFQAQKTLSAKEQRVFYLPYLKDPVNAKTLGHRLSLRPDWDSIKMQCMYEICMCKFMQHPKLRLALIATGNSILIEGNTWGDRFWGQVNGNGKNQLGLILMDIREKLKYSTEDYPKKERMCL